MAHPPPELGRGVVVVPGRPVPGPWATAPVVTVDDAALAAPEAAVDALHRAWADRQPVVVVLAVDPAGFRSPPVVTGEPWTHRPDLRLWDEEWQWLVWANTYDARADGPPVWWWARKALRLGATALPEDVPGDVGIDGVGPVWVDGGPRQSFVSAPGGLAVVHRDSVERQVLRPAPPWRAPAADLAADQLRAVAHERGPARIIAPAGSGKTRVLTERLRHLIGDRGWERDAVLAVAYNKKAQEELESRCVGLGPRTRTLNSLGLWVIGQALGRSPAVLGERDTRDIIRGLAPKAPRRVNTDPIGPYLEALGTVRLGLVDPDVVEAMRDDVPGLAAVFTGYREALAGRGAVDFDEQIYRAVELLLADGALRTRLQTSCRHLLVDEFQDLTPAHVLMLRLLAGPGADVFGVGDDDQVIYGHAGADPAFLIDYAALFPGAAAHALEVNFRCPAEVVTAAATLLSYNRRRVPKTIRSARAPGVAGAEPFVVRRHPAGGGAAAVATQVGEWLAGGSPPGQVAVLARVRSALLAPVVALSAAGLPVDSDLGAELLERTGLRAALAYLRIATAPEGRMAATDIAEILRRPSRGLPQWFPDRLRRRDAWSTRALAGLGSTVDDKVGSKVDRLVAELEALRGAAARGADAVALLAAVRDDIGLGGAMGLLDSSGREGSSHLDDLEALGELAVLHPEPAGLEHWLRSHLTRPQAPGGVVVSTVHRVKGMEWDDVVVCGVSAGLLPHRLADDEEEERRILHVAITRARHRAVVLADADRPSPFLAELDGTAPRTPAGGSGDPAASTTRSGDAGRRRTASTERPAPAGGREAPGPRTVEARTGLAVVVAGGYEGTITITATDTEAATVTLPSGAGLRVRWGEAVTVHGRPGVLGPPPDLTPEVAATEAALRVWRTGRARRDKVAPFIVMSDRVLRAIATARPGTAAQLRTVDGIGPTKLEHYGDEVLEVIAGTVSPE